MSTTTPKRRLLSDGDIFDYQGHRFKVAFPFDELMGPPWEEHDGHGIVSDWTTRAKRPGERVLVQDRDSRRYYDVQASIALARKDSWGCGNPEHKHATRGEEIACAVDADFDYCWRWANDKWHWVAVDVWQVNEEGEPAEYRKAKERESIGGIDGEDQAEYLTDTAYELAEQIIRRLEQREEDQQTRRQLRAEYLETATHD